MQEHNTQIAPTVRISNDNHPSLIGWLTNLTCYLGAALAMIYMTIVLYGYLQIDAFGYLHSVAQWLIGLFLSFNVYLTKSIIPKRYNVLFLVGLAVLVAIF